MHITPVPKATYDGYAVREPPDQPSLYANDTDRYSEESAEDYYRAIALNKDNKPGCFSSLKHYHFTHIKGRIFHALAILLCYVLGILFNFLLLAGCTMERFKTIWLLRVSTMEEQTEATVYIGYFFLCFSQDNGLVCINHKSADLRFFKPINETTARLGVQLANTAFSPAMAVFSVVFFALACFAALSEVFYILREGEVDRGVRRPKVIFWFFFLSGVFSAISCAAFWWGTRAAVNSRLITDETESLLLIQGPLQTFFHVSVVLIALFLAFLTSPSWWFNGFTDFVRSFHQDDA
jgi:hypothetical protein